MTGLLLGLVLAPLWLWKSGPLAIIILLAILTGGLHEDGLADVCDAVRKYRSREKMFLILKDSRIGAHGTVALICSILFRWQALAGMQGEVWLRLPAALGLSRVAMVLLAAWTPPAGDGLGRAFAESLPRWAAAVSCLQAIGLAALCGWPAGAVVIAANLLVLAVMRGWFLARLGGVTGDCLGAICQVSEAVTLGVLAWA